MGLAKVTIAYSSPTGGYLPLWYAQDTNLFQQHGLDEEVDYLSANQTVVAALLSGQVQFAQIGAGGAINAVADGSDLVIIAVGTPVEPYVLEVDPSITSAADLRGQKLGTNGEGGEDDIATRVAMRTMGLDPDTDVTILTIPGGTGARLAALQNEAIQGSVASVPTTLDLEAKGYRPLMDLAARKIATAGQAFVAQRSFVTAHPEVTQAYIDTMVDSVARVKRDKATSLQVLGQHMQITDEQALSATYDFFSNEVFPDYPFPSPNLFDNEMAGLVAANPKLSGFDVTQMLDPSFVQSAKDRGVGTQ